MTEQATGYTYRDDCNWMTLAEWLAMVAKLGWEVEQVADEDGGITLRAEGMTNLVCEHPPLSATIDLTKMVGE